MTAARAVEDDYTTASIMQALHEAALGADRSQQHVGEAHERWSQRRADAAAGVPGPWYDGSLADLVVHPRQHLVPVNAVVRAAPAMVPVGLVREVLALMVPAGCGWLVPEVLEVFTGAAGGAGELEVLFGGDRRHLRAVVPHLRVLFGRYTWAMVPPPVGGLEQRDMVLLVGLSQGLTYRQMAPTLGLAPDTVRTYAQRVYRRLGARNAAHAVTVAHQAGLLLVPPAAAGEVSR